MVEQYRIKELLGVFSIEKRVQYSGWLGKVINWSMEWQDITKDGRKPLFYDTVEAAKTAAELFKKGTTYHDIK